MDTKSRDKASSQTLLRGLALLEAVARGHSDLEGLVSATGLTRSTAHRLLKTLVEAEYLRHVPRQGYHLGPKLISLGFHAHSQLHLPSLAQPHLQRLAETTLETANLGILDGTEVVYIDKVAGNRQLQFASFIGARLPAQSTAMGKALIASLPENEWRARFVPDLSRTPNTIDQSERFVQEMALTARRNYALDLEENEPGVRCIAAPVRDASGRAIAAVSVSSAVTFMDDERLASLVPLVQEAAARVSRELGWDEK
jgi:DNA-binding IclR family transcriptional regulator